MTVQFLFAPTSDVTVTISVDDAYAGLASPSVLTFTPQNYSNAQVVTVWGESGASGTFPFDVMLTTASDDPVYQDCSDTWGFSNTRTDGPVPSNLKVSGNGVLVIDGDLIPEPANGTDYGYVGVPAGLASQQFVITNSGGSTVVLTNSPAVVVAGGSGQFTVTQPGDTSLSPGESTTFSIEFDPSSTGVQTGLVTISSTDTNRSDYVFSVEGYGVGVPAVSNQTAAATGVEDARLTGVMTAGIVGDAYICWGLTDGGVGDTGDWQTVSAVGFVDEDVSFFADVSGLATNASYWFRCYVTNAAGSAWSSVATVFSAVPATGDVGGDGVILFSDFSGRTVSGNTAQTIAWTTNGLNDPGDLTAEDAELSGSLAGLFDTADAAGHFAPDLNIDNEGAWAVSVPLSAADGISQVTLQSVDLDWQHYNNSGGYQTVSRGVDWTLTVTNASGTVIGGVTNSGVFGIAETTTFTFASPVELFAGQGYGLRIRAEGVQPSGNNTGLDALSVNGIYSFAGDRVANLEPANVGTNSADLRGILGSWESTNTVTVHWGTQDHGTNLSWANSVELGTWQNVASTTLSHTISLVPGMTYFYTFRATNENGHVWASPSWSLTTPGVAVRTVNHAVPYSWLASQNMAWTNDYEAAATNDPDGDGFSTWQEYWSGTDPLGSNSFLKIETVVYDGTNVMLQWQHVDPDAAVPPIVIQRSVSLTTGSWVTVGNKAPEDGTNIWSEASSDTLFYRLAVTNAP